jgi:putative Mg2+ transporter-C (MgtC) family protein
VTRDLLIRLLDSAFVRTLASFALAFILGTLIGAERQWRQRTAGLRTNVLVAVGAAAFTDLGTRLLGAEGATRIVSYIVSGIGFLGAGVILKEGTQIRALLRPLVNYINRLPIDTQTTEARYKVHVVTDHRKLSAARDILDETLEKVGYPILEIETLSETDTQVELAAILVPSSADPVVLDEVVAQLEKAPAVYSATWSVGTTP